MKKVQSVSAAKKASKALLAVGALAILAGCATINSEDEGQGRDRPTGGVG